MKDRTTYLTVTLALCCCLIGCSGGGGDDTSVNPQPVIDLPPDPGPAGLETVEGIDSDADGVRDDVQRFIALEYQESETTRAALTQVAIALQDQLLAAGSTTASLTAAAETMRAVECVLSVQTGGTVQERQRAVQRLQARVLNSALRFDAYREFDSQVAGQVISAVPLDQQLASCAVDPATLND